MKPRPLPALSEKQVELFWLLVDRRGPTECWPWKGLTTGGKYTSVRYGIWHVGYRKVRPHRVAYTLCKGPIPDGLTLDHVKAWGCTDTLCCNPDHLEPATMAEQIVRRDAGKVVLGDHSICKWGHIRPRGRKAKCVECSRMHAKRFRDRHPDRVAEYPSRQPKGYRHFNNPESASPEAATPPAPAAGRC